MKKQITLTMIGLFLLIANAAFAQDASGYTEFRAKMTSIFQYVNKDKVPTGLLSDYGLQLIDPNGFNGIPTDTNYVDFSVWKQLYSGMYDSRINTKITLQEPNVLFANLTARKSLAVMYLNYNKLDEKSLEKRLLTFTNEQIREVSGAASPYLSKELFVVSPNNTSFDSKTVSFTFDRQCYVSNSGLTVTKLEVNFNNGSGYQAAQWGVPVSCTYSSGGEKEIVFRMTFSNGKSLSSRTRIFVSDSVSTRAESAKPIVEYNIPFTSKHAGGTMQVIFCSDQTNKKFVRPLIIAEDMDVRMFSNGENLNLTSLLKENPNLAPIIDQLSQLYDIIYIDNNNGLDDITRNAYLFKDAIQMVNQNLFQAVGATVADSTYIVGLGMGGLVARIALNMMETNNEKHRVRKLISINTPYKGLNLPVGLQAFVRHIADISIGKSKLGDLTESIDKMEELLNSKAMRQMLIYNIDSNLQYNNTEYQNFMSDPNVTRKPLLCQNIAIAGGSPNTKNLLLPESLMLDYHGHSYLINNWFWNFYLLGNLNLKYDFFAKALPNQRNITVYEGHIYAKKRILFWHVNTDISHRMLNSTSDMYPIDGVSGTSMSMSSLLGNNTSGETSSMINDVLKINQFCCVPTVSALGLVNWKDRFYSQLQSSGENSMCNRYYYSNENNDYLNLIAFKNILISELAPKITGNTKDIWKDTELCVDNIPNIPLLTYNWSFSNNNFQVVSRKGAQAVIRPIRFGVKDALSVSVSIPFIGLSVNIPSIEVSSSKLAIVGDTYISGLKNQYKLNVDPGNSRVSWKVSEGIIIDSQTDKSIIAYTKNELNNPWIEATITANGIETTTRKTLISKGLIAIVLKHRDSWTGINSDGKECQKHLFTINIAPSDIPAERLDVCWGSTIKKENSSYIIIPTSDKANLITKGNIEAFGGICKKMSTVPDSLKYLPNDTLIYYPGFRTTGVIGTIDDWEKPVIPFDKDKSYSFLGNTILNVIVEMPVLKSNEAASGILRCSVSDYLGNEYTAESEVLRAGKSQGGFYPFPNPVDSEIIIKRDSNNEVTNDARGRSASGTTTAALYNNYGMVRSVTFNSSQTQIVMNVADLAEGTYYLNIIEGGNLVESQVIFIKH